MVKKYWAVVISIVLLDQITKLLVQLYLNSVSLLPNFLSLTKIHNYGAGFGILQGQRMILIWLPLMVIGYIMYQFDKLGHDKLGATLIIAGAIGNLLDRVFLGYVVDFISFSFWPAFNVADSAVSIGAVILIWNSFRKK